MGHARDVTFERPHPGLTTYGWGTMAKTATRKVEALDLGVLITLLSEGYAGSYGDSSLKVRRRYRKLIAALTKAKQVAAAEAPTRKQTTGGDWGS